MSTSPSPSKSSTVTSKTGAVGVGGNRVTSSKAT